MAIYYVYSGAGGTNNGSSWANAFTTLATAFATEVAGDTLYVAHDHAELTAGGVTLASSGTHALPTKVICVDRAGTVPPVAADRRTTGQVTVTGPNIVSVGGVTHYDGIIFIGGSTTAVGSVQISTSVTNSSTRLDNCSLRLGGSGAGGWIQIGNGSFGGEYAELNNTTMSFLNAGQQVLLYGTLRWRNTALALLGTIPTTLFMPNAARTCLVECSGVDLSAAGAGKTIVGALATAQGAMFRFVDCKLHASVTKSAVPLSAGSTEIDFVRSGASGVNYNVFRHRLFGTLDEETTIVRTGGATDGTTPLAWKVVTTANCSFSLPFECPAIAIWNDTTGSARTATIEGIWGAGVVPLNSECFVDVEYLGDASSPQGSFVNDGTANLLTTAANQTSSSATWGGSTTKFKLEVTFTPQQKGWVYARVKCAKASSTFYIDPLVTLT